MSDRKWLPYAEWLRKKEIEDITRAIIKEQDILDDLEQERQKKIDMYITGQVPFHWTLEQKEKYREYINKRFQMTKSGQFIDWEEEAELLYNTPVIKKTYSHNSNK